MFTPANEGGRLLDTRFEHSDQLWPWLGFLALYVRVRDAGAAFSGPAAGEVTSAVVSPPLRGEGQPRRSFVRLPLALDVIAMPPRYCLPKSSVSDELQGVYSRMLRGRSLSGHGHGKCYQSQGIGLQEP